MCTSLALPTADGRHLFGRTLDLDTHFGERVVLTPRRYPFSFADCYPQVHHYALLGMATVADGPAASGYPLYAEAMNEKGLCMAGLRFAKNAVYSPDPREGWLNLAPWELIPYLLGTCATVAEVREALGNICVVDQPFSPDLPAAPLHWHIVDADPTHGGLILEVTAEGMKVYDDRPQGTLNGAPAMTGVLTNDPPYPEQLAALEANRVVRGDAPGLPGDYSSTSRFIRAATLRRWAVEWAQSKRERGTEAGGGGHDLSVAQFFSILGAVSPTAGAVITPEGGHHRTLYTCCMDTGAGVYRWRTEGDTTVRAVGFDALDLNGEGVLCLS